MSERATIVVTGAAGGMGRAAAERLSAHGWNVVATDIDADRLAWTDGTAIVACPADISTDTGNRAMVDAAVEHFGSLDAAILNAALSLHGPFEALPIEDLDRMYTVNVRGTALGLRTVIPALRASGGGAIAITASTHGLAGDAGSWAYSASKHAVIGMAKAVAREVAHEGIRINVVCPGPTRGTAMSTPVEEQAPDMYASVARAVPLGRWAEADEIARVMEFMVSDGSVFMTGSTVVVDGGAIAGSGLSLPPHAD